MSETASPRRHSALRRVLLIARRDFIGYVMTVGFWLTLLGPLIGIAFGVIGVSISSVGEPVRYVSIVDNTGGFEQRIIDAVQEEADDINAAKIKAVSFVGTTEEQRDKLDALIEDEGPEAAYEYLTEIQPGSAKWVTFDPPKMIVIPAPARDLDALTPYLKGERMVSTPDGEKRLAGVLFINDNEGELSSEYWSTLRTSSGLKAYADNEIRREMEARFFDSGGLDRGDFYDLRNDLPRTTILDPTKPAKANADGEEPSQAVSMLDRVPFLLAAGLSLLLWLTIFSGSYMLLMSMIEEKVNKALEMMLASTRFVEILFGKLLGVALLTVVSMLPWILMGAAGLFATLLLGQGGIFNAVMDAFTPTLIICLILFFALGYLFYGAMFMAMGSLAESMQDSQTLVTPVLLLLTVCLMVVPVGLNAPDSPLVQIASFIPFSAPFAMIVRLPGDVALWEIALSALILAASTALLTWGAAKIFQHGILSGGGIGALKGLLPRRKHKS